MSAMIPGEIGERTFLHPYRFAKLVPESRAGFLDANGLFTRLDLEDAHDVVPR
jgi:hypothetical protein